MTGSGRKAACRWVVKIGSQVLCDADGRLDVPALEHLAEQVAALRAGGNEVLLVSSGAVAAGSGEAGTAAQRLHNPVVRRQVLAAAGQVRLMETWQVALRRHGLAAAQVLATKADFQTRAHYLNLRGCLEGLLESGLVPIINENDVVSVTELMFTDNDELAGLLSGMVNADQLVLLSSVPGVFGPGADAGVITEWDDASHRAEAMVQAGTSRHGRGGMASKLEVARKMAALGIPVVIAGGREPGVLQALAANERRGTRFPPLAAASPAKRWLASMDDHALGAVTINDGALAALRDPHRLTSLLPVGAVAIEGRFRKGDVIQVRDVDGRVWGCGRSQYDHTEAAAAVGQHDKRPLIHYDYLYLVT